MSIPEVTRRGQILALIAALLGWMFDGMEMGLFPLVGKDALTDLLGEENNVEQVNNLYGIILACFLVGAATGGVLFGWIGDKIGRVKAMTLSILVYSLSSGLSAFSTSVEQLAILRFIGALGMGGEWALGVALVMELWPDTSRVWLAAAIGVYGNLGYTICGTIALVLNYTDKNDIVEWLGILGLTESWSDRLSSHRYWRLLFLIGALPALLTVLIRIWVPESTKWLRSNQKALSVKTNILSILLGGVAGCVLVYIWYLPSSSINLIHKTSMTFVLITIIMTCYLYPAFVNEAITTKIALTRKQILSRMLLGAGLSGVPLLGTWAGLMWSYMWVNDLPNGNDPNAKPYIQISSSIGAACGCIIGAILAEKIGRKLSYIILCILSTLVMFAFYHINNRFDYIFVFTVGFLGLITASFYGWLPLYLPELFPTTIRATGQGFSFNFGRIVAAIGNLQMGNLLSVFDHSYTSACSLIAIVYILGVVLIIVFAPETKGRSLLD